MLLLMQSALGSHLYENILKLACVLAQKSSFPRAHSRLWQIDNSQLKHRGKRTDGKLLAE